MKLRTETVADASVFMGMHSADEEIRRACKGFFVGRFGSRILMSLEHVGYCDNLVWRYERAVQDAYYPFMDNLHTDMEIERVGYGKEDLATAMDQPELADIPLFDRLLLAMAINRKAVLFTVRPWLLQRQDLPIRAVEAEPDGRFSSTLEHLYEASLKLRVPTADL